MILPPWPNISAGLATQLIRPRAFRTNRHACGEIERALAQFVAVHAVGAAVEEHTDGHGIAAFGADHQRGAAAIVCRIDRRAAVEQQAKTAPAARAPTPSSWPAAHISAVKSLLYRRPPSRPHRAAAARSAQNRVPPHK